MQAFKNITNVSTMFNKDKTKYVTTRSKTKLMSDDDCNKGFKASKKTILDENESPKISRRIINKQNATKAVVKTRRWNFRKLSTENVNSEKPPVRKSTRISKENENSHITKRKSDKSAEKASSTSKSKIKNKNEQTPIKATLKTNSSLEIEVVKTRGWNFRKLSTENINSKESPVRKSTRISNKNEKQGNVLNSPSDKSAVKVSSTRNSKIKNKSDSTVSAKTNSPIKTRIKNKSKQTPKSTSIKFGVKINSPIKSSKMSLVTKEGTNLKKNKVETNKMQLKKPVETKKKTDTKPEDSNEEIKTRINLRTRKVKDYAIIADEDSINMPVYKRALKTTVKPSARDIYEFNEQIEKKEGIEYDSDSSNSNDKTMYTILKEIKKKEAKISKKRIKRNKIKMDENKNKKVQKNKSSTSVLKDVGKKIVKVMDDKNNKKQEKLVNNLDYISDDDDIIPPSSDEDISDDDDIIPPSSDEEKNMKAHKNKSNTSVLKDIGKKIVKVMNDKNNKKQEKPVNNLDYISDDDDIIPPSSDEDISDDDDIIPPSSDEEKNMKAHKNKSNTSVLKGIGKKIGKVMNDKNNKKQEKPVNNLDYISDDDDIIPPSSDEDIISRNSSPILIPSNSSENLFSSGTCEDIPATLQESSISSISCENIIPETSCEDIIPQTSFEDIISSSLCDDIIPATSCESSREAIFSSSEKVKCDLKNYFDFKEEPIKSKPVQIKQNVLMRKSVDDSPWRSHIKYRSTPYVLKTKRAGLPAYDKDFKLPSPLIKPGSSRTSTITSIPSPIKKPLKQNKILQYVTSNVEHDKENSNKSSLFEEHNLSPIKIASSTPLRKSKPHQVARNILGEINHTSLSFNELGMLSNSDNESSLFGFNKSNRDHQPNKNVPTRINLKEIKTVATNDNVEIEEAEEIPSLDVSEYQGPVVNLFENFETTREEEPRASYSRKRGRIAKRVNFKDIEAEVEECLDDSDKKMKKKPKIEKRTPQEEREYQEWIKKFNTMCDEVSQQKLHIEYS